MLTLSRLSCSLMLQATSAIQLAAGAEATSLHPHASSCLATTPHNPSSTQLFSQKGPQAAASHHKKQFGTVQSVAAGCCIKTRSTPVHTRRSSSEQCHTAGRQLTLMSGSTHTLLWLAETAQQPTGTGREASVDSSSCRRCACIRNSPESVRQVPSAGTSARRSSWPRLLAVCLDAKNAPARPQAPSLDQAETAAQGGAQQAVGCLHPVRRASKPGQGSDMAQVRSAGLLVCLCGPGRRAAGCRLPVACVTCLKAAVWGQLWHRSGCGKLGVISGR